MKLPVVVWEAVVDEWTTAMISDKERTYDLLEPNKPSQVKHMNFAEVLIWFDFHALLLWLCLLSFCFCFVFQQTKEEVIFFVYCVQSLFSCPHRITKDFKYILFPSHSPALCTLPTSICIAFRNDLACSKAARCLHTRNPDTPSFCVPHLSHLLHLPALTIIKVRFVHVGTDPQCFHQHITVGFSALLQSVKKRTHGQKTNTLQTSTAVW